MAYNANTQIKHYERRHRRRKAWHKVVGVLACVVVFVTTYALVLPAITMTEKPDTSADVETAAVWEATFADVELSGNWAADLLQIAQTQLGYEESERNFVYVAGDASGGYGTSDGLSADGETEDSAAADAAEAEDVTDTAEAPEDAGAADTEETEAPAEATEAEAAGAGDETGDTQEAEAVTEEVPETAEDAGETEDTGETEETEDAEAGEAETEAAAEAEEPEETEAAESAAYTELYAALTALYDEVQTYAEQAGDDVNALAELCVDAYDTAAAYEDYAAALYGEGSLTQEEYDALAALAAGIKTYVEELSDSYDLVKKGYTRYGAWYGLPYEDWCAMFVSFCLHYAEVPVDVFPQDASCTSWIEALSGLDDGLYIENTASDPDYEGEDYVPSPGDLVFFDFNGDGSADHVGIVAALTEEPAASLDEAARLALVDEAIEGLTDTAAAENTEGEGEACAIVTIEGNSSNRVQTVAYGLDSEDILGYGVLPENIFTLTAVGEDYIITVTYGPEAQLPEDVELVASEYTQDDETYLARYEEAAALYGWTEDRTESVRLFNIGFYVDGEELEPAAEVSVTITYTDEAAGRNYTVTHFADGEGEAENVEAGSAYEDGVQTVDFTLDSFSDIMLTADETDGSVVTGTVSPVGTVINLFDYWIIKQNELSYAYGIWGATNNNSDTNDTLWARENAGINAGHNLKFTSDGSYYDTSNSSYSASYGLLDLYQSSVRQGIVGSTLGSDGYPYLSGTSGLTSGNASDSTADGRATESLAYLFDPSVTSDYKESHKNVTGLLQVNSDGYYYYDSTKNYAEYNESTNSFTLYTSPAVKSASSTFNDGQFYPFTAFSSVSGTVTTDGTIASDTATDGAENNGLLNHYFGFTLTTKFIQQYDGYTSAKRDTKTTFEFSGDDDVWIFINGVLVADLGGIHDKASVTIDFAEGSVVVTNASTGQTDSGQIISTTYFENIFANTSVSLKNVYSSDGSTVTRDDGTTAQTLASDEYYTLNFYYLERGAGSSNMSLEYNLAEYPETAIYKVDQYGEAVEGAVFAVYASDSSYDYYVYTSNGDGTYTRTTITVSSDDLASWSYDDSTYIYTDTINGTTYYVVPQYTGDTDANGEMVFVDEDEMPYTLQELQELFGTYFILREVSVPAGYRLVSDEVHLYIENGLLLCSNTYESGVYSSVTVLVSAPDPVAGVTDNGSYATYNMEDGTLYAVVMKYIGGGDDATPDMSDLSLWAPVYGDSTNGRTVLDKYTDIYTAIATALTYTEYKFTVGASGAWQVELSDLPGDITTYYNYLAQNNVEGNTDDAEYAIFYFYTTAGSIEAISSDNTVQIDADNSTYTFDRAYGATIEVPNLINRMYAQKLNEDGELVDGAVFALYSVSEVYTTTGDGDDAVTTSTIYYEAKDSSGNTVYIYLYPDDGNATTDNGEAGDNTGVAYIQGNSTATGTYTVSDGGGAVSSTDGEASTAGVITVTIDDDTYTITPYRVAKTVKAGAVSSNAGAYNLSGEDGTASFTNLVNGYYYMREVYAPSGYVLNTTEVMVAVTDDSIMANAGTANDGVMVGRGPGYLVSSLNKLASEGEINETLTWVYGVLKTTEESTSFSLANLESYYSTSGTDWKYITQNYWDGNGDNWKDRYTLLSAAGVSTADSSTTFGLGATANTAAATIYLKYDPTSEDTSYDYVVNGDRKASNTAVNEQSGVNARRIFTDVGWSYLELYQDDEYALRLEGTVDNGDGTYTMANGADYTLLDSVADANGNGIADGMISSLFSRSLYVQVTDQMLSDLEISKTVVDSYDALTGDEEFTFTVNLYENGTTYTEAENVTEDTFSDGTYYTYDEDTGEYTLAESYTNGTTYYTMTGYSSELTDSYKYTIYDVAEDGTRTVAYVEAAGVTSDSFASGTYYTYDEDTSTYTAAESYTERTTYYTQATGTITSGGTVTLKDSQVIVIEDLPYNAWYTVTETDPVYYTTTVTVSASGYDDDDLTYTVSGRSVTGQLVWEYDEDSSTLYNTVTVAYTNTYDLVDITIIKTDLAGNTVLSGAQFVLYYTEDGVNYYYSYNETDGVTWTALGDDEAESIYARTSGAAGEITFHRLTNGTYYLKETAAPDGYNLLSDAITITVASGKVTVIPAGGTAYTAEEVLTYTAVENGAEFNENTTYYTASTSYVRASGVTGGNFSEGTWYTYDSGTEAYMAVGEDAEYDSSTTYYIAVTTYDEATGLTAFANGVMTYYTAASQSPVTYSITVTNNTGEELPMTGGSGTKFLYTLALALMLGAGTGLYLRKRNRRREA